MRKLLILFSILAITLCIKPHIENAEAVDNTSLVNIDLTTNSIVSVNRSFGNYQSAVDENIYNSLCTVDANTLIDIFGDKQTPMFQAAKKYINPCMALATTWGEAGASYKGISLTTVMDFNPNTYVDEIDWLSLTRNLEQVDVAWYTANSKKSYNINDQGEAYHMPNALLQVPKDGDRSISTMVSLGVGPYQITSSDWDKWDLDGRVNPIIGFENSLEKCGTSWINCGIDPISDLTVYAALSLSHQGGANIGTIYGNSILNNINTPYVQDAINRAGRDMFLKLLELSYTREVSLSDIDVGPYVTQVQNETGINFASFTGGVGPTNKGTYTLKHCLRYVFYKYYFTSGDYNEHDYKTTQIWEQEGKDYGAGLSYQSDYVTGTHEHVAYKQTDFIRDVNSRTSIAEAGCGWCSLTSAMAELNPAMCGGITPVDWTETEMSIVGESYWGQGGMSWSGPSAWIDTINEIGIYGKYTIKSIGGTDTTSCVKAIMDNAGDENTVVIISAGKGLFTGSGHIICVTDTVGNNFHVADSSTKAAKYLGQNWEDMISYEFPGIDKNGNIVTSINDYPYNFKCYWVIHREE